MAEREQGPRSEEPTPRRLAEARRQGHVPVSRELGGGIALAAVLVVLVAGGAAGVGQLITYLRAALALAPAGGSPGAALGGGLRQALALLALPLGVAAIVTLVAGLAQTGGLVTLAPLRWDPGQAAPSTRRVLSVAALGDVALGALKALIVVAVACLALAPLLRPVVALTGASAVRILGALGVLAGAVGWRLALAVLALGLADLLWQRERHRRALRMTRAEVERERKHHEGDPRHKAERQRVHRELLAQRPLAQRLLLDVRQWDFVVTGPDQVIALRYDPAGPSAPVVMASGGRLIAAQLEDLARAGGVPIFPDPDLAQALEATEEGAQIPEALHGPIAQIVQVILQEPARNR